MSLLRDEGGRKVKRKTEIFSLKASCKIIHSFCSADFSDYLVVADRFDELCEQEKSAKVDYLVSRLSDAGKTIPDYMNIDNMSHSDVEMLEILVGVENPDRVTHKKRRLVVDLIDGELVQTFEDEIVAGNSEDVRRIIFRATSERH